VLFRSLQGNDHFEREWGVLQAMVEAAGGRPMSVSCMQRDHSPQQWRWILEKAEAAQEAGFDVRAQVAPRGIGVLLGLQATFHPFMGHPTYKAMHDLPLTERVARMRDPEVKARMLAEQREPVAGDGSPLPALADFFLENIEMISMRLFRMAQVPDYEPGMMDSLAAEAMHRDEHVMSVIYDALLEDEGQALIYFPVYNYSDMNLDNVGEMLRHPHSLPGLSDGGAHVGTICDASFPTFLLTHWGRDRDKNRLPIEQLVKKQSHDTARFLGLEDRGTVAVGKKADLNVIDLDRLQLHRPELVRDLPAGGRRLMQRADGYRATLVSGEVVVANGEVTAARPGRWVRSGR
jgi:N-acyl-D-aspartate/D-glutamate deacylase